MNPELKVDQGSEEWFKVRSTRITASCISNVMARPNTKKYNSYLQQLIRANATGILPDETTQKWHLHGLESEPYAAAAFQWELQTRLHTCGMFLHPEEPEIMSASPDRLLPGMDAGVEIKSRSSWEKHEKVIKTWKCPPEHYGQVQMQILVCNFRFVYYVDYYRQRQEDVARDGEIRQPDMWYCRVDPDPEYQIKMLEKVYSFWEKIRQGVKKWQE